MYEHITYEEILNRMLGRIPDYYDKREGSIIFDALAPAAVELQLMYIEFDNILKEVFADTASREFLIRRAAERGIKPAPATHTILRMETSPSDIDIAEGVGFSCGSLNYTVIGKISDGNYKMQCDMPGQIGNTQFGQMIPISYISGLQTCYLREVLIPGEDEEDTEAVRKRYLDSFSISPFAGNKRDYIQKTNAIAGVGGVKVTPIWNGAGTVLLTIMDSNFNIASSELISKVQNEIDPKEEGIGNGIAPIGHTVTVQSVREKAIDIQTEITYREGFSFDTSRNEILQSIDAYFSQLSKNWQESESLIVRISRIEMGILECSGVLDISNTTLNGNPKNLQLETDEIPKRGNVNGA